MDCAHKPEVVASGKLPGIEGGSEPLNLHGGGPLVPGVCEGAEHSPLSLRALLPERRPPSPLSSSSGPSPSSRTAPASPASSAASAPASSPTSQGSLPRHLCRPAGQGLPRDADLPAAEPVKGPTVVDHEVDGSAPLDKDSRNERPGEPPRASPRLHCLVSTVSIQAWKEASLTGRPPCP